MISFQQSPGTFFVEETLAYEPSGSGDHVFAKIQKTGISTFALKRRLSESLGIPLREVRHAGKKDAAATATQWLSWPKKAQKVKSDPVDSSTYQIRMLSAHEHALAIGHVRCNTFRLLLSGCGQSIDALEQPERVFPNFFGPQRFGSGSRLWQPFMSPGEGPKPGRDEVSVRQARLFNAFLHERLAQKQPLPASDEIWMIAGGKRFFQAPLDDDLRQRFQAGLITPSGPIFGYKVTLRPAEAAFLAELGMTAEDFRKWGKAAKGARRYLWAKAEQYSHSYQGDQQILRFQLPAGVYATVFLLHLLSPQVLTGDPDLVPNFTQPVHWQKGEYEHRLEMVRIS